MLDLDKLRAEREAARREQKQEAPQFKFKGKTFKLPVVLSLDTVWALEEGVSTREFARLLLGQGNYEEFMALDPDSEDWIPVDELLQELYIGPLRAAAKKSTVGESQASDVS